MSDFTAPEIETVDALWRQCSTDHVWAGWARPGGKENQIWIFRRRANWRRFILEKSDSGYCLRNEKGEVAIRAPTLTSLLYRVESIPGLN